MMNIDKTNEELLKVQKKWFDDIVQKWVQSVDKRNYSLPFSCGISTKLFDKTRKTVMIVGQESDSKHDLSEFKNLLELQQDTVEYSYRQSIKFEGCQNNYKYNSSPFWGLYRYIEAQGYNAIWNNLNKFKYLKNGKKEIPEEDEVQLNRSFNWEGANKSLLLHEISIIEPDFVLFVTGKYEISMSQALLNTNCALNPPSREKFVQNIKDEIALGCPALWTYHPLYWSRCQKTNQIKEEISKQLKKFI